MPKDASIPNGRQPNSPLDLNLSLDKYEGGLDVSSFKSRYNMSRVKE